MSEVDPILLWLNQVPDPYNTHSHNYSVKRCRALPASSEKRPLKRRLLSPPPEAGDKKFQNLCLKMEQPSTPSKRQRITDVGGDATYRLSPRSQPSAYEEGEEGDPTPKAMGKTRQSSRSVRSGSTRSSNRSSRLSASTTASSSRKLVDLSLEEEGVVVRQLAFGDDTMPSQLSAMVEAIVPWSRGKRVIAASVRETVDPAVLRKWYVDTDLSFADESDAVSSSLPWDSVENILLYAKECFERHHYEMVWNIEVHQRLMEQVFRKGKLPRLVDFISW